MFRLQSLQKHYGGQVILHGADWHAPTQGVIGLVGPNGAGKTTLLRILSGTEEADGGQIKVPGGCRIGYLPQELAASDASGSALDTLLEGRRDLLDLEARLHEAEELLESAEIKAVRRHAEILEEYEEKGGWTFRSTARQIARGLGFSEDELDRPIATFSGGWQMRALLGRLLLSKPDVLLLDEPTNHLDTESLEWLEDFLMRYAGTVVVVSHDRWFLNGVAQYVVELQGGHLTEYPGNWDDYRRRKAERIEQLEAAANRQEREAARVRDFIERFRYKATKAKQVQSRERALEKLERIDVPTDEVRDIRFRFPQPPRTPRVVARLDQVAKTYGDNTVWESLDFEVTRGDKVALVGPNGAGKTTLLKILAGVLHSDGGEVMIGNDVKVAYFAQHAVESLDPNSTVLAEITAAADVDMVPRVRSILGAFGFSGDDQKKLVKVLSGGEKNRLALAKMMLAPAGLLLLDEPTNHLDIASRQVLEFALNDYDGAFVVVSHDRYFVNEVTQRIIHLEHGKAAEYIGDYDYYHHQHALEVAKAVEDAEQARDEPDTAASNSRRAARRASAEVRERRRKATQELRRRLTKLEDEIGALEQAIDEAERHLADPSTYEDEPAAKRWNLQYRESNARLEDAMNEWGEVGGEIESIEAELQ